MKQAEVDALAGRELDAAVAERVMGWRGVQEQSRGTGAGAELLGLPPRAILWPETVPFYSRDLYAAYDVLERMFTHWESHVEIWHGDAADTGWLVGFHQRDCRWAREAMSLPEAVCRAALVAGCDEDA